MGGTVHTHDRHRWAHVVVLTLAVIGALGVVTPAALAFDPIDVECANGVNTIHGDESLYTNCASCHVVDSSGNPVEPITPVNTKCTACHQGGYENRVAPSLYTNCWSCHLPGENKDDVQTSEGCAAATDCHLVDSAANLPHYGANTKGCVDGCHRTSAQSVPNGSPHHDDGLPGCYDCHDGAQALEKVHEPYANPRDLASGGHVCQLCHVGYATTHPDPATIVHRTMTLSTGATKTVTYNTAFTTTATLKNADGSPDALVYLWFHSKPILALDCILLKTATTSSTGTLTFPTQYPTSITTYRAYAKGEAATLTTGTLKPVMAATLVKVQPGLTASLSTTSLLLGKTVKVTSKITPPRTLGTVKYTIQKYVLGSWKTMATKTVAFYPTAYTTAYLYYKPGSRGTWRVKASVVAWPQPPAVAELVARTVTSATFVVK